MSKQQMTGIADKEMTEKVDVETTDIDEIFQEGWLVPNDLYGFDAAKLREKTESLNLLETRNHPNTWSVYTNFRFAWDHVVDRTQSQVGYVFVNEVRQNLIMFISGWLDNHGNRYIALINFGAGDRITPSGVITQGMESNLPKAQNYLQEQAMHNWLERNKVYP